ERPRDLRGFRERELVPVRVTVADAINGGGPEVTADGATAGDGIEDRRLAVAAAVGVRTAGFAFGVGAADGLALHAVHQLGALFADVRAAVAEVDAGIVTEATRRRRTAADADAGVRRLAIGGEVARLLRARHGE